MNAYQPDNAALARRPDETLPEQIERIIRVWPQWSPAEQRRMDDIVEDILSHCRAGDGNSFIREWCRRNLAPHVTLFTG